MPRIPISTPLQSQGSRINPRPVSTNAIVRGAGVEGNLISIAGKAFATKAAEAAKVKQSRADAGYIQGKHAQAFNFFKSLDAKLSSELGVDNIKYPEELGKQTSDYINNLASDAPDPLSKSKLIEKLSSTQLSVIGKAWTKRDTAFATVSEENLNDDLMSYRTMTREDWPSYESQLQNGLNSLDDALSVHLSPSVHAIKKRQFTDGIAVDAITGFVRDSAVKLPLIESIRSGSFDDVLLGDLYDGLDFKQREVLGKKLMDEYLVSIRDNNDATKIEESESKDAFNKSVLNFYLSDDPVKQGVIFDSVKLNPLMTPSRLIKMKAIIDGTEDSIDDPKIAFTVRSLIDNNKITSSEQLLDYIGEGLSYETARTEMVSKIQSNNDKRFQNAKRILKRELGIPEGLIVFDPNQPRREEEAALAELEKYYANNPQGDFVAKASSILEEREDGIRANKMIKIQEKKAQIETLKDLYSKNPSQDLKAEIAAKEKAIHRMEGEL